jgi:hypothetical protein
VSRIDDVIARSEQVRLPVQARLALEEAAGAVLLAKEVNKKVAKKTEAKTTKKASSKKAASKSTKKSTKKEAKKPATTPAGKKPKAGERCATGTQRNPKSGECDPKLSKAKPKKASDEATTEVAKKAAPANAEDDFFAGKTPAQPAKKPSPAPAPSGTRADEEITSVEEKGKKLLKKGKSALKKLLPKSWEEREAMLASIRARAERDAIRARKRR